ncbi:30S ribosomal protein S6--L-glutamate ligase [Hirschia baltica]|uniref:Probable alpha-L-glutamate ligase n=1 Tax=Hirschia baltica (strain ATCC 49814 / DSM 5838 / IFAM 1418) TaxID=582402 RepID=C6XLA4_HIRBI|nr:30S ribosomal protein S6--L-glutamate ligase [Hirschia baltica]ACT59703.1 alpha-L-glutamate ligase, RimK family [Hirschia baltica ATCC 49814]
MSNTPLKLGWEEWLSLPDLGLPAIRAKVDTGAKTSALHATALEPFGPIDKPQIRFTLRPNPDDPDLEVVCAAPVVDRREVTSSNGETELRYVIFTTVQFGSEKWPIQVTLTNRETMAYRMLFGRTSVTEEMMVLPTESCLQPVLSYDLYKGFPRRKATKRPLRIVLLTREPNNYSSQRLKQVAEERGHVLEMVDTRRCYMAINATQPEVHYDGKALPQYDAVIPRIGASMTFYGMAVLRQFEMMGAYCLNSAQAIGASRDKLYAHQLLARHRLGMPATAFASSPKDTKDLISLAGNSAVVVKLLESTQGKGVVLAETNKAAESLVDAFRGLEANFLVQEFVKEAGGADIRCFVVGNKVVGAIKRQGADGEFRSNLHRGGSAHVVKLTPEERKVAIKATKVMGLSVAGVDLLRSDTGPKILEVNSSPGLEGIEKTSKKDVAAKMIEHIEIHAPIINTAIRTKSQNF